MLKAAMKVYVVAIFGYEAKSSDAMFLDVVTRERHRKNSCVNIA